MRDLRPWLGRLVIVLLFVFPLTVALLQHGASAIYTVLFGLGMVFGLKEWKRLDRPGKQVFLGLFLLAGVAALSLVQTDDMQAGLKRVDKFFRFLMGIPIYLMVRRHGIPVAKGLLYGMLAASFAGAVLGIIEAREVWTRVEGGYNSYVFGVHAVYQCCILAAALFTCERRGLQWLLLTLGIIASVAAAALSGTRGAVIVLPVLVLTLLWASLRTRGQESRALSRFAPAILLLVLTVFAGAYLQKRLTLVWENTSEALHGSRRITSISARFEMWSDSLAIFVESPLLGTGLGDFKSHSQRLIAQGDSRRPQAHNLPHSIYFDALATMGLVGLITMILTLFLCPFLAFYRAFLAAEERWTKFCALAGLLSVLSFAVFGLPDTWTGRNTLIAEYCLGLVAFMAGLRQGPGAAKPQ